MPNLDKNSQTKSKQQQIFDMDFLSQEGHKWDFWKKK